MKVLGFTYYPKIAAVYKGLCDQTIRKGRRINRLDELLLFTWSGKPYRSPWLWRKRAICTEAIRIMVTREHIEVLDNPETLTLQQKGKGLEFLGEVHTWDSEWMDELARRDFIDPPNGTGLRDVLLKMHKVGDEGVPFQVIRWKNSEEQIGAVKS